MAAERTTWRERGLVTCGCWDFLCVFWGHDVVIHSYHLDSGDQAGQAVGSIGVLCCCSSVLQCIPQWPAGCLPALARKVSPELGLWLGSRVASHGRWSGRLTHESGNSPPSPLTTPSRTPPPYCAWSLRTGVASFPEKATLPVVQTQDSRRQRLRRLRHARSGTRDRGDAPDKAPVQDDLSAFATSSKHRRSRTSPAEHRYDSDSAPASDPARRRYRGRAT